MLLGTGEMPAAARLAGFRLTRTVGAAVTDAKERSGRRDAPQEEQAFDVIDEVLDLQARVGSSGPKCIRK
jgi:hypothetical protein